MHPIVTGLRRVVDVALEVPVVPSFTRVGVDVRSRLDGWASPAPGSLDGRVVLLTGGTSGIGRAAARELAVAGADVIITGRDLRRTTAVAGELTDELKTSSGGRVRAEATDMGDLDAVRRLATRLLEQEPRLDVVIHNAGALTADRRLSPQGFEQTVASQVYGPFLLTSLLLPALRSAGRARVVTVSSGGMYAANLEVERLEMGEHEYRGAEQYARAKRAQVTLNEMWAEREAGPDGGDVVFHAMHPGWADTPGVESSLPVFRTVVGPLLRTPEQGADTMVWLAADDGEPLRSDGGFWLDRRRRRIHRLPTTRRSDTPAQRARLWSRVHERSGAGDPHN